MLGDELGGELMDGTTDTLGLWEGDDGQSPRSPPHSFESYVGWSSHLPSAIFDGSLTEQFKKHCTGLGAQSPPSKLQSAVLYGGKSSHEPLPISAESSTPHLG